MSDSEGVLKIKGDNSDLDAKTNKSLQNFQNLGEHAQRATRHARSFGEAWEHANSSMTRSIAHGLALTHVMGKVASAMVEAQNAAATSSKAVGADSVSRDIAAQRLGISNDLAETITTTPGAATREARLKFFSSLASVKFGRGRGRLTTGQVIQLQSAHNSGAYSDEELHEMVERGDLSGIDVNKRIGALSGTSRNQLLTGAIEYSEGSAAEAAMSQSGFSVRRAEARLAAGRARTPALTGFNSVAESIPFGVGEFYKGVNDLSGRAFNSDYHLGIEKSIAEQTGMMRKDSNKPTLAPGAQ